MPNIFDNARTATEQLFEGEQQISTEETAPPPVEVEESVVEQPAEGQPEAGTEMQALDEATQVAEAATQAAEESNAELRQAMDELEVLRRQNEQMQGTIEELSRQNEENIVEELLEPPVLDVSALAFADEETVRAAQTKHAEDMAAYTEKMLMKKFSPVIEQANKAKYAEEKANALSVLSQIPDLEGIEDMMPQIERIMANNKALASSDIPLDEKIITAYAIARGVGSMNTPPPVPPKEKTPEELLEIYNNNPDFQALVEKQRLEQIKESQQVPQHSASSGAVNAALNIKEKPKTFEEASERTRKMFGL